MGGKDTRDQVSHGKLVVKEHLDASCSTRGEKRMLRNPGEGDKDGAHSDYMGQHLGGLVESFPITPWGDNSLLSFH